MAHEVDHLQSMPTEILSEIIHQVGNGMIGTFHLDIHQDINWEERERVTFFRSIRRLRRLCLVSRRVRQITQPHIFQCSGPILFRGVYSAEGSPASSILLLIRTLACRPDLRKNIKGISFVQNENDRVYGTGIDWLNVLCAPYRSFYKDIQDRQFQSDVEVFAEERMASWKDVEEPFPLQLVQKWNKTSIDLPLTDVFTREEMDNLITFLRNFEHDLQEPLPVEKIFHRFCKRRLSACIHILFLLSPAVQSLVFDPVSGHLKGAFRIAQYKKLQNELESLETVHINTKSDSLALLDPDEGKLIPEVFFSRLPQVKRLVVTRGAAETRGGLFTDFLPFYYLQFEQLSQSKLSQVKDLSLHAVRGLDSQYIEMFLKCFPHLESFSFRHMSIEVSQEEHYSDAPMTDSLYLNALMRGLEQQKTSLVTLKIRCMRLCPRCSGNANLEDFQKLQNLEIFHKTIGFGVHPTASIVAALPQSLQQLTMHYEVLNTEKPRKIPEALTSSLEDCVQIFKGIASGNRNVLSELDWIALLRCEHTLHDRFLFGSEEHKKECRKWLKRDVLKGERGINKLFEQNGRAFYSFWDDEGYFSAGY